MSRILVATIALMVTRDAMTILPTTVPKHEVEVQNAIFGEENVQVLEDQSGALPTEIDPAVEHERLEGKYGPGALEKAFGANYKTAIGRALKEHIVEAMAAGPVEANAPALETMTKAQLLAEAEKRGVGVVETMTKAEIINALNAA